MDEPKFRPGPWKFQLDNFGDGDGWQYTVVAEGGYLIAVVFPATEDDTKRDVPAEGRGNAQLIAAATALYDFAVKTVEFYDHLEEAGVGPLQEAERIHRDAALRVLAKARGES